MARVRYIIRVSAQSHKSQVGCFLGTSGNSGGNGGRGERGAKSYSLGKRGMKKAMELGERVPRVLRGIPTQCATYI